MTVKELIELLQKTDLPDNEVEVSQLAGPIIYKITVIQTQNYYTDTIEKPKLIVKIQ